MTNSKFTIGNSGENSTSWLVNENEQNSELIMNDVEGDSYSFANLTHGDVPENKETVGLKLEYDSSQSGDVLRERVAKEIGAIHQEYGEVFDVQVGVRHDAQTGEPVYSEEAEIQVATEDVDELLEFTETTDFYKQ